MSLDFSKRIYGYDVGEVEKYIESLTSDYEEELTKKKDRLVDLMEQNRKMTSQLEELTKLVESYKQQEDSVGMALIKAEESAKLTIASAERQRQSEIDRISSDVKKWQEKSDDAKRKLVEFEEQIVNLLEKYQDEINYLTSKDIKKLYFGDDNGKSA